MQVIFYRHFLKTLSGEKNSDTVCIMYQIYLLSTKYLVVTQDGIETFEFYRYRISLKK